MKKISLITFCLLAAFCFRYAGAQDISLSMAEKAAGEWLRLHNDIPISSSHQIMDDEGLLMAYCFDLNPSGYIILASSQHLPPVLAYSFTNNYINTPNHVNPLEDIIVRDIGSRLEWMEGSGSSLKGKYHQQWRSLLEGDGAPAFFEQWPPAGSTSTGGWLETNWKQSSPYNIFCPMDNVTGSRSVAGCPAVALAMIIHYQKNLNGTQFSDDDDYYHNYAGRQYWIDDDNQVMDFPSFPRLNEYFDSMAVKFPAYIPLNENEVAALVFTCGVAARQVYTSEVSGTFGVTQAFEAYERFAYQDAILIYDSDTSFYTHMKNNMKEGIPVHLALLSSTGSGGHNVVTDGYNTDDYYHLNFGWGGSYNGWYLLPDEIPYNLTIVEGAIMDIGVTHVGLSESLENNIIEFTVYPNPTHGPLNIHLKLEKSACVNVELSDMNGRLIKKLHSGHIEAGNYNLQCAANLKGGIYFLTVSTENNIMVKKLLVLN